MTCAGAPRVRLVAFDLDGTLTRGDTVVEAIARRTGHLGRIRELEALCRQRRDRESIRQLRAESATHYRSLTAAELRSYLSALTVAPGAREGFDLLRACGIRTAIVSITWEFAVEWLARELGADYHVGTRLLDDGSVDHVWPEDKAAWLEDLMRQMDVRRAEAAAVGDSWLDAPMLGVVGRAIYLGETLPPGIHADHLPHADILDVAHLITGRGRASRALGPRAGSDRRGRRWGGARGHHGDDSRGIW